MRRLSKAAAAKHIAPTGVLRAGINLSNFLLVNRVDDGTPVGLSPDIAAEVARRLNVPCEFYTFKGPGELTDAIGKLDIANLANEKKRAKTIRFAPAYCAIEASLLIRGTKESVPTSSISSIVSKNRSAYTLALEEIISSSKNKLFQGTKLLTASSVNEGFDVFMKGDAQAFACLKPKLNELAEKYSSEDDPLYILEGSFTEIRQCVGCNPELDPSAAQYLDEIVLGMLKDGFIEKSMKKHGVEHSLCLPS
jgi:polar amino acid transport system substrate-binding protein